MAIEAEVRALSNVLVTGGSGFIGSNLIRILLTLPDFQGRIINVDKLTYAGNRDNLSTIERTRDDNRYVFEHGDICDASNMQRIFEKYDIDTVLHLAAESHVDRSILAPGDFIQTNIVGTFTLLEAARAAWGSRRDVLFHHVSTDEVFGSLDAEGYFDESTPYDPRSPYSASKASSDHLVRAYKTTYEMPVTISNCSNNYGPFQFPEKLIPVVILNILDSKDLPVYGDGRNVRDWIYVDDHCSALWRIVSAGPAGETYLVGGDEPWENIKLVTALCEKVAARQDLGPDAFKGLIRLVGDRPGHDRRYAIDSTRTKRKLGWQPTVSFSAGLDRTIDWYLSNMDWVNRVRTGSYRDWIVKNYARRDEGQTSELQE